ncbi:MAG: multidrug efflux SMR transporter [Alphaproteobacteria bacterium]|nr:multidrug efflux SMR transporter [Alphaproteobacteria bacterium]
MAWLSLIVAGILEVGWAVGLKYTEGFTRLKPTLVVAVCTVFSFVFLANAARSIPIGTAYAIFTGIGAVGVALFGMMVLGESRDWPRLVAIATIIAGAVALKLVSADA